MAVYARLIQRNLNYTEGTNVIFDIAYGVVDTAVPKSDPYVVAVPVAIDSPGTWEQSFKDAVVADANAKGYVLTSANLRWDVSEPADYKAAFQACVWSKDVTKTNIPAAYANVYVGSGGEGQLVNAFGCKQYRLVIHVNKIGTGVHDSGLMDVTNSANVIAITDSAAAGEKTLDSGWTNLPAWLGGSEVIIKPVARDSLATGDPVYRQFALYLR